MFYLAGILFSTIHIKVNIKIIYIQKNHDNLYKIFKYTFGKQSLIYILYILDIFSLFKN